MGETITEERLRELESQCGDGSFDDGYGFHGGGGEGLSLSELRALIAGYRGYRNGIANIEYAQSSGMVFCRMDILKRHAGGVSRGPQTMTDKQKDLLREIADGSRTGFADADDIREVAEAALKEVDSCGPPPTITIPVAEYERLKRRANRFSLNELLVVLNVYENHLIDRYGWGDYPAEETTLVDNFRAAIKEQEG